MFMNKLIFHNYFNKFVLLETQWFNWKKLKRERTILHFLHLLKISFWYAKGLLFMIPLIYALTKFCGSVNEYLRFKILWVTETKYWNTSYYHIALIATEWFLWKPIVPGQTQVFAQVYRKH